MKNLTQKIGALVLAGAGLVGCATQPSPIPTQQENPAPIVSQIPIKPSQKGIDLRNGFYAESYSVQDNINLITEVFFGEAILKKTEKGYTGIKTQIYHTTPSEKYDNKFDEFCRKIDNGDRFLGEMETEHFLDNFYDDMFKIIWVEDE
jgi:hypothetical protein